MTFRRSEDGKLYGTIEVLLTRMVEDESETLIGHQSPFGGIIVDRFDTSRFVEERQEWWEAKGFTVTAPPLLEEARRLSRSSRTQTPIPEDGERGA